MRRFIISSFLFWWGLGVGIFFYQQIQNCQPVFNLDWKLSLIGKLSLSLKQWNFPTTDLGCSSMNTFEHYFFLNLQFRKQTLVYFGFTVTSVSSSSISVKIRVLYIQRHYISKNFALVCFCVCSYSSCLVFTSCVLFSVATVFYKFHPGSVVS